MARISAGPIGAKPASQSTRPLEAMWRSPLSRSASR